MFFPIEQNADFVIFITIGVQLSLLKLCVIATDVVKIIFSSSFHRFIEYCLASTNLRIADIKDHSQISGRLC